MDDPNDPRYDPSHYKLGLFYYNRNDDRIILPKRNRLMGWTMNFAKPETHFIVLSLIAIPYLIQVLARL
jgi:uncharacterized membrane protein